MRRTSKSPAFPDLVLRAKTTLRNAIANKWTGLSIVLSFFIAGLTIWPGTAMSRAVTYAVQAPLGEHPLIISTDTLPPPQDSVALLKAREAQKRRQKEARYKAEKERRKQELRDMFKDSYAGKGQAGPYRKKDSPKTTKPAGLDSDNEMHIAPETISGDLNGREVAFRPKLTSGSEATGRVVIKVCADRSGAVTTAAYQLAGSTTANTALKNKAISWARQFRFAPSAEEKQCGNLTFHFKIK